MAGGLALGNLEKSYPKSFRGWRQKCLYAVRKCCGPRVEEQQGLGASQVVDLGEESLK